MTIKQLMKKLSEFPQDADVIIASDAEQNSRSLLEDVYGDVVYKKTEDLEEMYGDDLDIREKEMPEGGDEDDVFPKGTKGVKDCVVLTP